ncbi:MAG: HXXEE domain-containing protein [Paenibacillaceae bacterium]|nr:HXXEE domain-containing protein [Paenibacillaceae bacterium]
MAFLETVTVSVDLTILIWLIPVVFFIHDGEEVLMVRRWLRRHQSQPSIVKATRFLASDKYVTGQFAIAIFLLGVSLLIVTYTAAVQYHSQKEWHLASVSVNHHSKWIDIIAFSH